MFDQFITWEMLQTFASLTVATFMVVEYFKELPGIKSIPTKYFAGMVALILISLMQFQSGNLTYIDIPLYLLSAIAVTFASTGVKTFNDKK